MKAAAVWRAKYSNSWTRQLLMSDPAVTTTQVPSASPSTQAAAAASGVSPSPTAQPNSNASAPNSGSFVQTPPAATPPAAVSRPEWLPESFWDSEKSTAKADAFEAATAALTRKAGLPKTAEEYQPVLPKGLPDDLKIDVKDPRFIEARKVAHEAGLTQDEFSKVLGLEAQRALAQAKMVVDGKAARDAELGPNGAARIDTLLAQAKAAGADDKEFAAFQRMLIEAPAISFVEKLMAKVSSQGVDTAARGGAGQGQSEPGKIEGYEKMSFAQRWVAGEARRAKASG